MSLPPGTRNVLITGGGTGIGLGVARCLLARGGKVAVAGRRREPLDALAAEFPGRVAALPCDLASADQRQGLLGRAKQALGGLDGFVSSAGVIHRQSPGHIPEAALREQLEVNLVAPLRLGEEALATLEPGGGMVFISSTLALRPLATTTVYSMAKAGTLALVQSLALAGAPRLRVNAISPGIVDTDMARVLPEEPGAAPRSPEEQARRVRERLAIAASLHPLGRLGTAEEVAEAVVQLLGAGWTTGTNLVIDGGVLIKE